MLDTFVMIVKLIAVLLIILPLIYVSIKFGGERFQGIQSGNYMKILEKLQTSKENSLLVVKIGEKGYIISSTVNKIEIIKELTESEISKIENSKKIKQYKDLNEFFTAFKNKLKTKKED